MKHKALKGKKLDKFTTETKNIDKCCYRSLLFVYSREGKKISFFNG